MTAAKSLLKLAKLCQAVYKSADMFGSAVARAISDRVEGLTFIKDKKTDTQVGIILFNSPEKGMVEPVIVFRGTEVSSIKDWFTDLKVRLVSPFDQRLLVAKDIPEDVKVHRGFNEAAESVFERIVKVITPYSFDTVLVIGHSLGGALAQITGYHLAKACFDVKVVTFGAPQVGNKSWAQDIKNMTCAQFISVVNNNDFIPTMPPFDIITGYVDVGTLYLITEGGKLAKNPTWWVRFQDSLHGRWNDLFELGTDGFKDHRLDSENGDGYIPQLKKILARENM